MAQTGTTTWVTLSDTHNLHLRLDNTLQVPPGDVLLFAGDAGLEDEHDAARFDKWLGSLPHRHKIVCWGNMDFWGQSEHGKPCPRLSNALVLCDESAEVLGYRITASPWTPKFEGAFQLPSATAAQQHWARLLPQDARVDILITHGPPKGYGDCTGGRSVGDAALLQAVLAMQQPPQLWVCGHIHESAGQYSVPHRAGADILLINAAVAYLARPGADHASVVPRVVALPSRAVTQPTLQDTRQRLLAAAEAQKTAEIWRAPTEVHM